MRRHRTIAAAVVVLAAILHGVAVGDAYDPPAGYYSAATGTGATLKSQLTTIMSDGHIQRTYGDLRYSAAVTDVDPNNANNIILMYNRASVPATWDPDNQTSEWNREHIWPVSLQGGSNPSNSTTGHRADPHALRPANPLINSTRGNSPFGLESDSGAHGFSDSGPSYYYPGDADRGDAARSLFYSATRWSSLGLTLVDSTPGSFQMGDLSSLIQWHFEDVPDTFERRRNQAVYSQAMNPLYYTNNRNAYVDRPEFVWSVFVDQANDSRITVSGGTTDANGSSVRSIDYGRVFTDSALPPVSTPLVINKTGLDGTYYEVTIAGQATSTVTGRNNAFRTNVTGDRNVTVGLNTNTATVGLRSGTVTVDNLDVTTGGGAGRGANDGNDTINMSLTVLDHATPSFVSDETVTLLTHDFGTFTTASIGAVHPFQVFNRGTTPEFTASMDFDSVLSSGDTSVLRFPSAGFAGFLDVAGGASENFSIQITPVAVGSFAANYTLRFSDEDIPGAENNKNLSISLTGSVVLAGDFNRDGEVDTSDYVVWRKQNDTSITAFSGGDADGSGFVDALDLGWWELNFGMVAAPGGGGLSTVPEPGVGVMLLVVVGVLCGRRCR